MNVKMVTSTEERELAYSIRKKVFVEEQNVPLEEEIDQYEDDCAHFLLFNDEETPIGNGRFRILDGIGKVQRICVLSEFRGNGAGQTIMNAIEDYAKKQDLSKLKLDAQTQAIPFYERLGYREASEEFMDAGIPHRTMIKDI